MMTTTTHYYNTSNPVARGGALIRRGSRWGFDLTIEGNRVRRFGYATEALAAEALEDTVRSDRKLRLADAAASYLSASRLSGKASSVASARVQVRHLERVLGEDFDLTRMGPEDAERFAEARFAEGVGRASVNAGLRILRAVANRAYEQRLLPEKPRVKLLREQRRLPSILSDSELESLFSCAEAPVDLVLLLAAHAGLRHQEIVHLSWEDINLEDGTLRVTPKAGWSPKNHQEREVPLSLRLRDALQGERNARVARQDLGYWLFPGYEGGPRTGGFASEVRAVFVAAGLYDRPRKPGLHMLRRTCASTLLGNGVDIQTVRELMAWADLTTPMAYLRSTDDRKRSAMEGLR